MDAAVPARISPLIPCLPCPGPLLNPLVVFCPSEAELKQWLYHLEKQIQLCGGSLALPLLPQVSVPRPCPTASSRLGHGWIPSGARLWGCSWGKKGAKRAHQRGLRATGRGDVLERGAATHRCHQQHNHCGVRALGLAQRGSHAFGFLCNRPEIAKPLEEEAEAQKTGPDSRDCLPQSLRVF